MIDPGTAPIEDGVYLGLDFETYIAQDALGSTDFSRLYGRREGWWWQSRHNIHRKARARSDALNFGSALHTLLLEGKDAYSERYAVAPNPNDFPGLLVTAPEIYSALTAAGVKDAKPKMRKGDLVNMAKAYLDVPIWDAIMEKFERQARGKDILQAAEHFAVKTMYEAALSDETIRPVVEASSLQRLTEVSVFWTTPEGVRIRYRFDTLLPSWNADLKSIGNMRDRAMSYAVGDQIASGHLDVQLAMSFEARRQAYQFIQAGQLYGGSPETRAYLEQFPARAPLDLNGVPGWNWLWIFYGKPEDDGAAPVIFPLRVFWGDGRHLEGWRKFRTAYLFYLEKVAAVGLDAPWSRVEPVHDTNDGAARRVMFPPWEKLPEPQLGELEAMQWQASET